MSHKVNGLTVLFEKILYNRVVLVNIAWVLITSGYAVSGNDSAVHRLCRIQNGGKNLLCIYAVNIGVMKQSLGLKHLNISNSWKIRECLSAFHQIQSLIYLSLIRSKLFSLLSNKCSGLQACQTNSLLVVMGLCSLYRLAYTGEVYSLGEWSIFCSKSAHIDNTLLETNDRSCSNYCHSL